MVKKLPTNINALISMRRTASAGERVRIQRAIDDFLAEDRQEIEARERTRKRKAAGPPPAPQRGRGNPNVPSYALDDYLLPNDGRKRTWAIPSGDSITS
jgi:hypothetical protein